MVREAPAGRDPADTIARRAMEETARNKKVLPTHLVAGTLMSRERLTKRELHPAAAEELKQLIAFHRERYGSAPDLDDSFSGGIGRAVEAGLWPMTERRIVKKGLMLPRRFYLSNRVLGRFYANQLDHRIYPQWSGHNLTVVNAGAFGYTLTTHLGRKFDADPANTPDARAAIVTSGTTAEIASVNQATWGRRWIRLGDVDLDRGKVELLLTRSGPGQLAPGRLRVARWPDAQAR